MSKALIIIDIQNDYFDGGAMELHNPVEASENAKQVLNKFRNENEPVIHVQHIAAAPEMGFFLPNTKGVEIHNNVKPQDYEKLITKHTPNSFIGTDLLDYLKSKGITELVFTGMMTNMCIDATVRAAKDYGFNCTVIGDACASKDLEINGSKVKASDVQHAFLAGLDFYYAEVVNTKEYLSA